MQPTRSEAANVDQSLMTCSRARFSLSMHTWKSLVPVEPSNEAVTPLAARQVPAILTVGTCCARAGSEEKIPIVSPGTTEAQARIWVEWRGAESSFETMRKRGLHHSPVPIRRMRQPG